jgi:hypothetical protein
MRGWWIATFAIDDSRLVGCYARDIARVGAPVSAGFEPRRQERIVEGLVIHRLAELVEVSLVERGAYDGARIISVLGTNKRTSTHEQETQHSNGPLVRNLGSVIAVR